MALCGLQGDARRFCGSLSRGCTYVLVTTSSSLEVTWVTSPDLLFHSVIKTQSSRKTQMRTLVCTKRLEGAESLLGHESQWGGGGREAGGEVSGRSLEVTLRPA